MFDRDYTLTGKHATFPEVLAVKIQKKMRQMFQKLSEAPERYIDVYMNAAVWGICIQTSTQRYRVKDRARIYAMLIQRNMQTANSFIDW